MTDLDNDDDMVFYAYFNTTKVIYTHEGVLMKGSVQWSLNEAGA